MTRRKIRKGSSSNERAKQGCSDGPPKSVQVDFLWGKNDVKTAIEHEY